MRQRGFSAPQVLLMIVVVGLLAGTGWFVWQAKNKTNDTLASTAKSGTEPQKTDKKAGATKPTTNPTADWTSESNTPGKFSLKHPKSWAHNICDSTILLAANSTSLGHCASEDGGQINISSTDGDHVDDYALKASQFTSFQADNITVDDTQGQFYTGIYKASADDALSAYPDGARVTEYTFYANNGKTYIAVYIQKTGYVNILNDFIIMVTETLTFTP